MREARRPRSRPPPAMTIAAVALAVLATLVRGDSSQEVAPPRVPPDSETLRRATAWLRARQLADGSFEMYKCRLHAGVMTGVVTCALALADEPVRRDARCEAFAVALRVYHEAASESRTSTSSAASTLMAVDALHTTAAHDVFLPRAFRLDTNPPPDAATLEIAAELGSVLCRHQTPAGGWSQLCREDQPAAVYSTSLAILGIEIAATYGADVPVETFERAAAYLVRAQMPSGPAAVVRRGPSDTGDADGVPARRRGWGYTIGWPGPCRSATHAALAGLLVCRARLLESGRAAPMPVAIRESIRDGLAWVDGPRDEIDDAEGGRYGYEDRMGADESWMATRMSLLCVLSGWGDHGKWRQWRTRLTAKQSQAGSWGHAQDDAYDAVPLITTALDCLALRTADVIERELAIREACHGLDFRAAARLGDAGFRPFVQDLARRWIDVNDVSARRGISWGLALLGSRAAAELLRGLSAAQDWRPWDDCLRSVVVVAPPLARQEDRAGAARSWEPVLRSGAAVAYSQSSGLLHASRDGGASGR